MGTSGGKGAFSSDGEGEGMVLVGGLVTAEDFMGISLGGLTRTSGGECVNSSDSEGAGVVVFFLDIVFESSDLHFLRHSIILMQPRLILFLNLLLLYLCSQRLRKELWMLFLASIC